MYIKLININNNNGDNMLKTLYIIPRSLLSLFVLFLVTKIIGKKQVSELSLFDYVIGISIGNFAAEMIINYDNNYLYGIVAMITFGIVAWVVSFVTMKSIVFRRIIVGVPTILIQNGKIIENNLKKVMLDINDLLEQCRNNGTFDINEIEYAIMEANGKISILPKKEYSPLIVKDMNLKLDKNELVSNVIIDGNIIIKNLENSGKEKDWLLKELKIKGKRLENILLGTLDSNYKLNLYERNYNIKVKDVLE